MMRLTSVSHMSYKNIALEVADGIVTLTINRPAKLNALNAETLGELEDFVKGFESEASWRILIVTGSGDKAFVAGADIGELAAASPAGAAAISRSGQGLFRRLELANKPSIAAINGFALGGGLELAMACTLRVASFNAQFGQPEVRLGMIAGFGGTQRLPRLVGRGKALELLLTGEMITASEAQRVGLLNHVVAPEELQSFCFALARKIGANGPMAVGLTMQAVDISCTVGIDEGSRFETAAFTIAAATEDRKEGTSAFLEKRTPVFLGK
jgi:enoyl-CoA hydratase